ncbi:molybdopterin-guanine dinucleotide biosynthesis protein B [Maledivibacter halophilus]|uniref:Molybdopterin guanine dinucleotide biosynthesis accessory protein MobB n=1 Tax=Maledivibacter halophilus TaxID=36842 RepID=A0A1T5MDT7_9FIRM|nr:molybdopterin-guanine dinucleotide biosynthesis protein B [Maledivibacter halophilus]SKC86382.1 molybdopterin guanine dinucleotide biosynthesis accessory protein MobB [Maledivibacter halophilus]
MKKASILSIISRESNTGKTTFIQGIVPKLTRRGYKIMTLKYSCYDFNIDYKNTDSYKHFNSGAVRTVLVGPQKCAVIEQTNRHKEIYEIVNSYNDIDLIIAEGFRNINEPTIEIIRESITKKIITSRKNLIAIAADTDDLKTTAPIYNLNDYCRICDFIENTLLNRKVLNITG